MLLRGGDLAEGAAAVSRCWGWGWYGQLGTGSTSNMGDGAGEMGDALAAVELGTGRTAVSVSTGYAHTCTAEDDTTEIH